MKNKSKQTQLNKTTQDYENPLRKIETEYKMT